MFYLNEYRPIQEEYAYSVPLEKRRTSLLKHTKLLLHKFWVKRGMFQRRKIMWALSYNHPNIILIDHQEEGVPEIFPMSGGRNMLGVAMFSMTP